MSSLPLPSVYGRFRDAVHSWASVENFLGATSWNDGIHQIFTTPEYWVDVLIRGDLGKWPEGRRLPVFFNGAVTRGVSEPPFFSGSSLAVEVGAPVIAIADPTLNLRADLGIGWYLGSPKADVFGALSSILLEIGRRAASQLLLVGGSAGGFAALKYANHLGVSAFVWNPQTDLLHYSAFATRPLLGTLLPDGEWESVSTGAISELPPSAVPPIDHHVAEQAMRAVGLSNTVGPAHSQSAVLYLQNETDHHVERHARPYIDATGMESLGSGIFVKGQQVVAIGGYNTGHRAPPREVVDMGLRCMMRYSSDPLTLGCDMRKTYGSTT